jgi:hypothetical protein
MRSKFYRCSVIIATLVLSDQWVSAHDQLSDDRLDTEKWRDEKTWPPFAQVENIQINPNDKPITKLLKQRHNAVLLELRRRYTYWLQNVGELSHLTETARRLMAARLAIGGVENDRVRMLKELAELSQVFEAQAGILSEKYRGAKASVDVAHATSFRLDIEIELLQDKAGNAKGE